MDMAEHFGLNLLALGLSSRATTLDFVGCDLQCSSEIATQTQKLFFIEGNSFVAALPKEYNTSPLRERIAKIRDERRTKTAIPLHLSVLDAQLPIVLGHILKTAQIDAGISHRVQGQVTANLNSADAVEVLAVILHFFHLTIHKDHGKLVIRPDFSQ